MRPLPALLADLAAGDEASRVTAAFALAEAGDVPVEVIQALIAALDDHSERVREGAAWALFHVKSPGFQYARLFESKPKPTKTTRPRYPEKAFARRTEGTVLLDILISATGQVVHATVRQSVPAFDAEALRWVREWRFEPAVRNRQVAPIAATVPAAFRIY
jgi:TonB family protein